MERENIFILLYRRDTWTKTLLVLCLHANTMSGVFFWSLVQIPSSRDGLSDQEGGAFFPPSSSSFAFVRQKCVLVPFRKTHSTQSREHRKLFCDRGRPYSGAQILSSSSTQSESPPPLKILAGPIFLFSSTTTSLPPSASSSFFCSLGSRWLSIVNRLKKKNVFCVVIYVLWCWYCT